MRGPSKINVERFRFTQQNMKNQPKNYPIGINMLRDFWIDFCNDFWSIFGWFLDWFWHQNLSKNDQKINPTTNQQKWSHLGLIFGRFFVDYGAPRGAKNACYVGLGCLLVLSWAKMAPRRPPKRAPRTDFRRFWAPTWMIVGRVWVPTWLIFRWLIAWSIHQVLMTSLIIDWWNHGLIC